MNKEAGAFQVVDLPLARQVVISFLDLAVQHRMFALLEADVTIARQVMKDYKARTGERLSFTGWLAFCLARAVDEDKSVQAYLKGRKQIALFDDVDVGMMIERRMHDAVAPAAYVLRRANHKSFMEIHREIRALQTGPDPQPSDMPAWLALLLRLPGPLQALFHSLVRRAKRRDPARRWVAMAGTVGLTSVGMFGKGSGWGVAPFEHTLCLIVGGISRRPWLAGDRVEAREILSLTVGFDHDVVDGAPAARFVTRLVELIESGSGLADTVGEEGTGSGGQPA